MYSTVLQVEEQRRYLGGDSDHTVLVKGLDFALLEQQKAKLAADNAGADDDALEAAFLGLDESLPASSKEPSVSRKRTREEIIQELKNKRSKPVNTSPSVSDSKPTDASLDSGKFKPLGFKPIGSSSKNGKELKKKRKKAKDGAKTTQADENEGTPNGQSKNVSSEAGPSVPSPKIQPTAVPEAEPVDDGLDIFADVGEYEGVNFDDDDAAETRPSAEDESKRADSSSESRPRKKWFEDEPDLETSTPEIPSLLRTDPKSKARDISEPKESVDGRPFRAEEDGESELTMRLAPLASSAVPSIRDILAADTALEVEEKRKVRKEKRKAGKGEGGGGEKKKVSAEAKLNRDYQKLQSYQAKKDAS